MSATAFQRLRREAKAAKPEAPAETPDRDSIAKMKKPELREWLEAHGAEASGSVSDMRDVLTEIMFVEI